MRVGREEHEWCMTAAIRCEIANVKHYVFARENKAYVPDDFNPLKQRKPVPKMGGGMAALKAMFVKKKKQ